MLRGRVIESVWATKRLEQIPNGAFLEVEVEGGGSLIAFDVLGSGVGERVLVATGSVASGQFPDHPPIDALIIGSIDDPPADAAAARKRGNSES
jgi:ethanolamine utilization protein EutN